MMNKEKRFHSHYRWIFWIIVGICGCLLMVSPGKNLKAEAVTVTVQDSEEEAATETVQSSGQEGTVSDWVKTTSEATGDGDSIYIAGNPDKFPVEYYNSDTRCYEGILPELLKQIGEKTGLRFTYIQAGKDDERTRLARNGQVELISGYGADRNFVNEMKLRTSPVILKWSESGEAEEVYLVFTVIAGEKQIQMIENSLDEISGSELAEMTVSRWMTEERSKIPTWTWIAVAVVFILLIAFLFIILGKLKEYKQEAERDERFDLLTGIGNKYYFVQCFEKYISDQKRALYSLIYIGFQIEKVNKYYGESEAENQLKYAAKELMVSTSDINLVARLSGGGFAVVRAAQSEEEAGEWTKEVLHRLNRYGEKSGKDFHPNFYAGIYMLRRDDIDCATVLNNAARGYHYAVSRGTPYEFSNASLLNSEKEKMQLKKGVFEAIEKGEFKMFLQPIIDRRKQNIIGAESLSRWEHPTKGMLHPGKYIEIMEEEASISNLDFFIFEMACRQLEEWKQEGKNLFLSCNFTRMTIAQEDFAEELEKIAGRYEFDYSNLVIEITEDVMEKNKEMAFDNISRCKALGFKIALDDIGSGYTSFSDLRDYPIDIVKIDRSILNSAVTEQGIALLGGLIILVHSLKMMVLCEGVETQQQFELLSQLNCDYVQGYYFYRPLPKGEICRILDEEDLRAVRGKTGR
ncbi:EAL domain-containing protein [Frisingicoccus sp.]|uniref:EAL domain-containing protein n=1 Tax=Frisingicoccus sp. TaxID=1918627 RepID=UPI00399BC090